MMKSHYGMLGLNLGLSALVMYLAMFTMIDGAADFYNNINTVYMTLMMVSPMAILMILMMGSMYSNRRLNLALHVGFGAVFILSFWAMRTQALVGDEQFLRSMIPHHSGAILMCRESAISDPEIAALCGRIITSQREEIAQMKRLLERD
jgi:uncharacterized protein (DUF305 family)